MPFDSNVPRPKLELAQWADARKAAYATSYASIGLALGQAEAFHADADAFGAAIEKQEAARLAYRSATDGADAAAARLTRTANGCVKSVRGFAEAAADPAGVLGRAMLSPRKTNTPRPAPDAPVRVMATLDADGDVSVTWNGPGPSRPSACSGSSSTRRAGRRAGWTFPPTASRSSTTPPCPWARRRPATA